MHLVFLYSQPCLLVFYRESILDCSENKIVNYELVPELEALKSRDLVRIKIIWLAKWDDFRTVGVEQESLVMEVCSALSKS